MKHSTALSEKTPRGSSFAPLREEDHPECQAELIHLYDGFWSDVNWGVFYCPACDQIICCVEGGVHWWNYTSIEPRPENLLRGREAAAQLCVEPTALSGTQNEVGSQDPRGSSH